MGRRYLNFEYEEPINVASPGDDFELWEYNIKNLETGNEFRYRIQITKSSSASKGSNILPTQVQDAVDTSGKSLVEKGLAQGLEYEVKIEVGTQSIICKAFINGGWNNVTNRFL